MTPSSAAHTSLFHLRSEFEVGAKDHPTLRHFLIEALNQEAFGEVQIGGAAIAEVEQSNLRCSDDHRDTARLGMPGVIQCLDIVFLSFSCWS